MLDKVEDEGRAFPDAEILHDAPLLLVELGLPIIVLQVAKVALHAIGTTAPSKMQAGTTAQLWMSTTSKV